jgi:acetyl-CoA carboxylase/biotin carboxylase 1
MRYRRSAVRRRHQKIIEEAPVTIAEAETFEKMERATVRLAKLVGYVNAGTVECEHLRFGLRQAANSPFFTDLYNQAEDDFYFLGLNPRPQVSIPPPRWSPVSICLLRSSKSPWVSLRIVSAISARPLPRSTSTWSNLSRINRPCRPGPEGHVVAVGITARNPDAGFKPPSDSLQELNLRSSTMSGVTSLSAPPLVRTSLQIPSSGIFSPNGGMAERVGRT